MQQLQTKKQDAPSHLPLLTEEVNLFQRHNQQLHFENQIQEDKISVTQNNPYTTNFSQLIEQSDIFGVVLSFIDCFGKDISNLKLSSSHLLSLVNQLVPLHHFVSILQYIDQKRPLPYPVLQLPTHYFLPKHHCARLFSNTSVRYSVMFLGKKRKEEEVKNIFTTFLLHYHSHPFCLQVVFFFTFSGTVVNWMSQRKECYRTSPFFCTKYTRTRLKQLIQSVGVEKWKQEKEWSNLLMNEYVLSCNCRLSRKLTIEELHSIIECRTLLLVILSGENTFSKEMLYQLLEHPVWKQHYSQDWSMQIAWLQCVVYNDCADHSIIMKQLVPQNENQVIQFLQWYLSCINDMDEKWKKNKAVIKAVVRINASYIRYADASLHADKDVAVQLVQSRRKVREESWKQNKKIVLECASINGNVLEFCNLNNDVEVGTAAIQNNGLAIQFNNSFRRNREMALLAVKQTGLAMDELFLFSNDEEVVFEAVKQHYKAILDANDRFRTDKELRKIVFHYNEDCYRYFNDRERDLVLLALRSGYGYALNDCKILMEEDWSLVYELLKKNGSAVRWVPKEFMSERVLMTVLEGYGIDSLNFFQ